MVTETELCGCGSDREVEETRLREVMLFKMHPNKGNKLWNCMHLSCTKGQVEQRSSRGMCTLWMPWLCKQRLEKDEGGKEALCIIWVTGAS